MPVFSLEPSQTAWCAELRALAAQRLRPLAEKAEPGRVNRPLVAALGELGLLKRLFTSGALDLCLMRESLAYGCTEAETALALQGLGAHPVAAFGTSAQRDRVLPGVAAGREVAAFALSEPDAGSDAAALALRAEPDGPGRWRLTGRSAGSPTPRRPTTTPSSPAPRRTRAPAHHRLHPARRPSGTDGRTARHAVRAPHRRPRLRRGPGHGRRRPRRTGRRLRGRHAHPDPLPPQRRRVRRRHGPGRPGRRARAHRPACGLRRRPQGPPVGGPPGRGDGHPHGGGPPPRAYAAAEAQDTGAPDVRARAAMAS